MANLFSSLFYNVGDWMAQRLAGYINDALAGEYTVLGSYYSGNHRTQLKSAPGAKDDNIVQNFVGLAVDRSVSRLWRGGVKFNLPEGAEAQQKLIDRLWDLNKKEILLYQLGLHGSVYGTFYFKIAPGVIPDPFDNVVYPRLIALDPEIVRIQTDPQDMNQVEQYKIEYTVKVPVSETEFKVMSYREIIKHAEQESYDEVGNYLGSQRLDTWVIENWEMPAQGNWVLVATTPWPYTFPPVIHGKNLPSLKSCYGDSDIDDAIGVQDKSNFVVSNTGKIIKHHASPNTIGIGFSVKDMQKLDNSPDNFWAIPNPEADVKNLEMQSDLASSRAFAQDLRQSIFDIAREPDISSMADRIGQLTNFGLHILWADATDKNDTKRQLYGDFLLELNRRLLLLGGFEGPASNPGSVRWGNALPINILEDMQTDQLALGMGIVDKGTVAARYEARYGKTWEEIQEALAEEGAAANQANADIGAQILRNFNQGQGAEGETRTRPLPVRAGEQVR